MENTLGIIIKTARINAGLSQLALADLCDLSISQIKNIERGIAKSPHLSTLKKLANVLNLDLKKLNYSYNSSNDVSEKNLSTIIYTARINAGLSQSELANLCDLSKLQISNIERGRAKRPYLFTLETLSRVLNLNLQELKQICGYP